MTLPTAEEVVTRALNELKQALDRQIPGHERRWAQEMTVAVAHVVAALKRRQAVTAAPQGLFAEVFVVCSTLARQVSALRQEQSELMKQARSLAAELSAAAQAFRLADNDLSRANPLPAPKANHAIPHFGKLRASAERLLEALDRHQNQETKLILESVTTEIGVGD
jgi:hypothetical protein